MISTKASEGAAISSSAAGVAVTTCSSRASGRSGKALGRPSIQRTWNGSGAKASTTARPDVSRAEQQQFAQGFAETFDEPAVAIDAGSRPQPLGADDLAIDRRVTGGHGGRLEWPLRFRFGQPERQLQTEWS